MSDRLTDQRLKEIEERAIKVRAAMITIPFPINPLVDELTGDITDLLSEVKRLKDENQQVKADQMILRQIVDNGHHPCDKERIVKLSIENARLQAELDAAKVSGEWSGTYRSGFMPGNSVVCTACDCWSMRASDYCPNCGARMKGGK